jgi:hypothetical protein
MEVMTTKQVQTLVRNAIQKSERQSVMELTSYFEKQIADLNLRIRQLEDHMIRGTAPNPVNGEGEFVETLLDGLGKRIET